MMFLLHLYYDVRANVIIEREHRRMTRQPQRIRRARLAVVALVAFAVLAGGGTAFAHRVKGWHQAVIVDVTGTVKDGFKVHWSDGYVMSPGTDSEQHAECSEYSTRAQRLTCHQVVDTDNYWLAHLKRALNHR